MDNPLFEPRLPLVLGGTFLLFWLVGAIGKWLRGAVGLPAANGFFVCVWVVATGLVSYLGLARYGIAIVAPAALSAALSLLVVYLVSRMDYGKIGRLRAVAATGGVAILATLTFPACLLVTMALFGVDGP